MIFDKEQAMKITGGDTDLLRDLVEIFRDQRDAILGQIEAAIESNDSESLKRAAHSMKGALLNLGGRAAGDVAFRLETTGAEGNTDGAKDTLRLLRESIAEFELAVTDI